MVLHNKKQKTKNEIVDLGLCNWRSTVNVCLEHTPLIANNYIHIYWAIVATIAY